MRERLQLGSGLGNGSSAVPMSVAPSALAGLEAAPAQVHPGAATPRSSAVKEGVLSDVDPRMQSLLRMIEAITGMPVRLFRVEDMQKPNPGGEAQEIPAPAPAVQSRGTDGVAAATGWGLVYEHRHERVEVEQLAIQAQGRILTADGRTIAFDLGIQLNARRVESSDITLRAGDAILKDPLVLHFEGPVGALRDTRFQFDLDADGRVDTMPFVGQGSGFLVLDRNGNGQIDDGRELFGALSGDGFGDLTQLDDDRNGWIDEADAVFQRLQVWRMSDAGQTLLSSLASEDVGALYLGKVGSEMALQASPQSATLGQLRSTGLYLRQSGAVGLMQQVDLVV